MDFTLIAFNGFDVPTGTVYRYGMLSDAEEGNLSDTIFIFATPEPSSFIPIVVSLAGLGTRKWLGAFARGRVAPPTN